jgi:hypothetical protein
MSEGSMQEREREREREGEREKQDSPRRGDRTYVHEMVGSEASERKRERTLRMQSDRNVFETTSMRQLAR